MFTRSEFIKSTIKNGFLLCNTLAFINTLHASAEIIQGAKGDHNNLIEARYYSKLNEKEIQCELCPHKCVVSNSQRGECGVRENRNGKYFTLVYNHPCALNIDPIEKKPLFHVYPGAKVFSLATAGCNLKCLFCQNWQISQAHPEDVEYVNLSPDDIIERIKLYKVNLIAYTYSEPTIFYEYMLAIAKKAKEEGIVNTSHSNGFINSKPLAEILGFMSAVNVDLKGFTEQYYKEMCGGELKPVLRSLKQIKKSGVHLELTTLIIPSKNDSPKMLRDMCKWIKNELGEDVPLHLSRFYPKYKLKNLPPTPVETLIKAREIAMEEGLDFVYIGNLRSNHESENTYCPKCKKRIIERRGYLVISIEMKNGRCKFCDEKIAGLWM